LKRKRPKEEDVKKDKRLRSSDEKRITQDVKKGKVQVRSKYRRAWFAAHYGNESGLPTHVQHYKTGKKVAAPPSCFKGPYMDSCTCEGAPKKV
jgi:hypothetical protein